jgi:hypothetical protein
MIPNWKVYTVVIISKGTQDRKILRVCLPLDESETAFVNDKNQMCSEGAQYIDQERKKNDDYLENLRSNPNFPKRKRPEIPQIPINNITPNINMNMNMNDMSKIIFL